MRRNRTSMLTLVFTLLCTPAIFAQNFMLRSYNSAASGPINRGDFNNDGIPDVVYCGAGITVAISSSGGVAASFKTTPTNNCQALAVGDFNRDGKLDVVVGSAGNSVAQVFLGNGNGTFTAGQTIPIAAQDLVAGDFNNDGKLDLAVVAAGNNYTLLIYPGNGNGTFGTPITLTTKTQYAYKVRVADFDGDGKTDIALSGSTSSSQLEVFFNNGNYSFAEKVIAASGSYLINTSDINQDGYTDMIVGQSANCVSNPKDQTCTWYLQTYISNGKARTFSRTNSVTVSTNNTSGVVDATAADVNGDGINDIVTVGKDPGIWAMGVWYGHANGTIASTAVYYELGGGTTTNSIVAFDPNRDGRPDFAVTNAGAFNVGLSILLNAVPRAVCATYTRTSTPTVCQPSSFTYYHPNVHFLANGHDSAHPVTKLQVYVDNSLIQSVNSTHLDFYHTLGIGAHSIVVKEWDTAGISHISPHSINVFSGSSGSVCSTALNSAHICIPAGASSKSPVRILAAGYPPSAPTSVQLYVDGSLKVSKSNLQNYIDTAISMGSGSHTVIFKVWDAHGHVVQATKTISVP